jgi:hypothetical protein
MLDEKQDVLGNRAGDPFAGNLPLKLERFSVTHASEANDPQLPDAGIFSHD